MKGKVYKYNYHGKAKKIRYAGKDLRREQEKLRPPFQCPYCVHTSMSKQEHHEHLRKHEETA